MREKLIFAERASVDRTADRLIETYASLCGRVKVIRVESFIDRQTYWLAARVLEKGEYPIHLPGRRWHTFRGRGAAEKACRIVLRALNDSETDTITGSDDMPTKTKKPKTKKTAAKASAKQPAKPTRARPPKKAAAAAAKSGVRTRGVDVTKSGVHTSDKVTKLSALDAAAQILAKAKAPMSAKEIVDAILAAKLWSSSGKTPDATLYAAMIREIAAKGKEARFVRPEPGKFALASAS